MKYKCPCCHYYTFDEPVGDTYDICPICFWEDDGWQLENPDEAGGANNVSLKQARINFQQFGASESAMKKYVRAASYEDSICADIQELLTGNRIQYPGLSIEAHLEVVCGNYFVQGEPDRLEYVYWPVNENNIHMALYDKCYMVAIISETAGFAFVCEKAYDQFYEDTKDYHFKYIRVNSLDEKNLMCKHPERLPQEFWNIIWIDDDFMDDDKIAFDYEAFERIDSGIDYINPKHFSIYEFARSVILSMM